MDQRASLEEQTDDASDLETRNGRPGKAGYPDGERALLGAARRTRILELAVRQGVVHSEELARLFHVSQVTIRNDLDVLARQGLVLRERGGATVTTRANLTTAFAARASEHPEEKRRIGYRAARLVQSGDTLIMDGGSTLMEMANSMDDISPLTVVTHAVNVAAQIGALPSVNVILTGGTLDRDTVTTVGPHAVQGLNELVVRKLFLGAQAVHPSSGLTDSSMEIAQVKQAMLHAAQQVILLIDSSKWGRRSFAKVAPLSAVHTVVSDNGLPADARATLARLGIELIIA